MTAMTENHRNLSASSAAPGPISSSSDAKGDLDARDAKAILKFKEWSDPEMLEPFLVTGFDEAKFLGEALIQSSSATLQRLNNVLSEIDQEIRTQVISHHADLFANAAHIGQIETKLSHVAGQITELKHNVQNTKASLLNPYNKLTRLAGRLRNMQRLAVLLRQCLRVSQLNEKLQATMKQKSRFTRDLARAALSFAEIQEVLQETNLSGISSVDQQLPGIKQHGDAIRSEASELLWQAVTGVASSAGAVDQKCSPAGADLGGPLQVFLNLGKHELAKAVDEATDKVIENVRADVRSALDVSALSEASGGSGQLSSASSGSWRPVLWARLDKLSEAVLSHTLQVWRLARELHAKRDLQTHALMVELVQPLSKHLQSEERECGLLFSFWKQACKTIGQELDASVKSSSFLRPILVNEYPRLSQLLLGLANRLNKTATGADRQPVLGPFAEARVLKGLQFMERAFLSRRLSSLNEPVQQMFPQDGAPAVPTLAQISLLVRALHSSLDLVKDARPSLVISVANCVNKVLLICASRLEALVTLAESSPFPSSAHSSPVKARGGADKEDLAVPAALKNNAAVFGLCLRLHAELLPSSLASEHPFLVPEALSALEPAAGSLHKTATLVLDVLAHNFLTGVQPYVFALVRDDFSKACTVHPDGSLAIQRLKPKVLFFRNKVLPLFRQNAPAAPAAAAAAAAFQLESKELLLKAAMELNDQFATLFMFAASLISPLHNKAGMKLASDITLFEMLMAQIGPKLRRDKARDGLVRTGAFSRTAWFKELLFAQDEKLVELAACPAAPPAPPTLKFHNTELLGPKVSALGDRVLLLQLLLASCGASNVSSTAAHVLLSRSLEAHFLFLASCSEAARHQAFTKAYAAVEGRINIPKGKAGRTYIQDTHPRLHLITKLLKEAETGGTST